MKRQILRAGKLPLFPIIRRVISSTQIITRAICGSMSLGDCLHEAGSKFEFDEIWLDFEILISFQSIPVKCLFVYMKPIDLREADWEVNPPEM